MLTGAFSTICLIRANSNSRSSFEILSETSWPMLRNASRRSGLSSSTRFERKSMVPTT